jgi:hypothetical protein
METLQQLNGIMRARSPCRCALLFLALAACSVALPPPPPPVRFTPTQHGVLLSLTGRNIEIAVAGPGAFRISSSVDTSATIAPIESPMLAPVSEYPSFSVITPSPDQVGIKASYGSLLFDTSAQLLLFTAGSAEFPAHPLFPPSPAPSRHNDTCSTVQQGVDAAGATRTPGCPNGLKNMTQTSCCAACNADPDCKFWVLAPHDDITGHNCWLLASLSSVVPNPDRTMGAVAFPPGPPPFQSLSVAFRSLSALYFGGGGHAGQQLTRTSGSAHVANTDRCTRPLPRNCSALHSRVAANSASLPPTGRLTATLHLPSVACRTASQTTAPTPRHGPPRRAASSGASRAPKSTSTSHPQVSQPHFIPSSTSSFNTANL